MKKLLLLVFFFFSCKGQTTVSSSQEQNININPEPTCEEERDVHCSTGEVFINCGEETLVIEELTCKELEAAQCRILPERCDEEEIVETE